MIGRCADHQHGQSGDTHIVEVFDFGDGEPIKSRLVGEFKGFEAKRQYTLENGEVWQQTDATVLYGVRGTNLPVTIRPGALGAWWMRVEGSGVQAKVQRIK